MKTILRNLPPFLLMLLFIYAAMSKLIDFADFRSELYNQTFPHWLCDILVYALPITELITAWMLMTSRFERAGLWVSLLLLLSFTGYIGMVLLGFWARVPCSCGGILSHMSWQAHLVFNICCIYVNLVALHQSFKRNKTPVPLAAA